LAQRVLLAPDLAAWHDQSTTADAIARLAHTADQLAGLAVADAAAVRQLRASWPALSLLAVARAAEEPDDLRELGRLSRTLLAGGVALGTQGVP